MACLIVPAVALVLFGPRMDDGVPADRVVVDYWEKWTGHEEEQMRELVDEFNATVGAEKKIFVRYVSTSSIQQKTLIATSAGVPPDVAGLWDSNLAQFASTNALLPLDEMAAAHGITESTYKPAYWRACHINGKLYSLISTPAAVALHYNKKAFHDNAAALRAAGLDPDRAPQSIDELDAYSKVLEKRTPSGAIASAGYMPLEPGWYTVATCAYFGGRLWDPATNKITLTDPAVVKAYEWVQSYSRRLGKDAVGEYRSSLGNMDSPQNPFLSGTLLMEQQGPWMANYIRTLKPSMTGDRAEDCDWAAAPFPSALPGGKQTAVLMFDALVIPRGAKHPAEAFEFIAWINQQKNMERLCTLHCKNSPLAAVSKEFLTKHPNPYIAVFEQLASTPDAYTVPQIPIWAEVDDELATMTQRLTLQNVDARVALQESQDRLQAKFDKYLEKRRARGDQAALAQSLEQLTASAGDSRDTKAVHP